MSCTFVSTVIEQHGYARGTSIAICRCTTHDWEIGSAPIPADCLCPIGRIEQARDDAIEAIRNERANATQRNCNPDM